MTLNEPYLQFQGHAILWRRISQNRTTCIEILIGTYACARPTQSTNNQTYMHRVPKSNQIKSNLFQATRPIAQTQMTIKHMTKKVSLLMFGNNFGKCGPIYKILSPGDSCENYLCRHHKDFHLTCNVLLHYLVKIENLKTLPNCHVKIDN